MTDTKIKTHFIVKTIYSSLHSKSKIIFQKSIIVKENIVKYY